MLDTLGKRLKCCRAATATTPQQIVAYVNEQGGELSYTSYTRWEAGSVFPKRKMFSLELIAAFFEKQGLNVSYEWILKGEGFPPQFSEYSTLDEDTLFTLASRVLPESELIQIGGMYGEPFTKFGELCIISSISNIHENNEKLCFIKTMQKELIIGLVKIADETNLIVTRKNDLFFKTSEIVECKRIKWILKK